MNKVIKQLSISMAAMCLANIGYASDAVGPGDNDSRWIIGGSVDTDSNAYVGEDFEAYLLPHVEFNGETIWLKNGTLNVSFGEWNSFSGGLTTKLDGRDLSHVDNYKDNQQLAGLERRNTTVDGGVYMLHTTDQGRFRMALYTDLGNKHNGQEVQVEYIFDLKAGDWHINPMIGAQWLSHDKVNHFYGVSQAEALPAGSFSATPTYARDAYEGGSTVNYFAGVRGRYELTEKWDVNLAAGVNRLGSSITNSSIVEDDYSFYTSASFRYNFN
jgi:outer membrane protein